MDLKFIAFCYMMGGDTYFDFNTPEEFKNCQLYRIVYGDLSSNTLKFLFLRSDFPEMMHDYMSRANFIFKPYEGSICFELKEVIPGEQSTRSSYIHWDYANDKVTKFNRIIRRVNGNLGEEEPLLNTINFYVQPTNEFYFFMEQTPEPEHPFPNNSNNLNADTRLKLMKIESSNRNENDNILNLREVTPPELGYCLRTSHFQINHEYSIIFSKGVVPSMDSFGEEENIHSVVLDAEGGGIVGRFRCIPNYEYYR